MVGAECDDTIDDGFQAFTNKRLQDMALDRQSHASLSHNPAGRASNADRNLVSTYGPPGCFDTSAHAIVNLKAGYLAILDDINATAVCTAGVSPGDCVM